MINYTASYDSEALRGNDNPETPRPWDILSLLKGIGHKENFLDVGCGTAFKLVPLAPFFENMYCLDISQSMLMAAITKLNSAHVTNAKFVLADSHNMPFEDGFFDVVSCMLSRWSIAQLARVMKPDATLLVENIGCEDKKEFKLFFGKDKLGYRGQLIDQNLDEYLSSYKEQFSEYFQEVTVQNGYWETQYTEKEIFELLNNTPTIRNFSENDIPLLHMAIDHFKKNELIILQQNRILIHAKYPKGQRQENSRSPRKSTL